MSRLLSILLILAGMSLCSVERLYADSAGAPVEGTHFSPGGRYYLHLAPFGRWLSKDYYIQWTFGETDGPVYFRQKGFYPTDVKISADGRFIVAAGNYVHNTFNPSVDGLWFYRNTGELVRRVGTPRSLPPGQSASSIWWFLRSWTISKAGLYVLQLYDGSRRIYRMETGRLLMAVPAVWQLALLVAAVTFLITGARALLHTVRNRKYRMWLNRATLGSTGMKLLRAGGSSFVCATMAFLLLYFCASGYFHTPPPGLTIDENGSVCSVDRSDPQYHFAANFPFLYHKGRLSFYLLRLQALYLFLTGAVLFFLRPGRLWTKALLAAFLLLVLDIAWVSDSAVFWPVIKLIPLSASVVFLMPAKGGQVQDSGESRLFMH